MWWMGFLTSLLDAFYQILKHRIRAFNLFIPEIAKVNSRAVAEKRRSSASQLRGNAETFALKRGAGCFAYEVYATQ
ncbi:hypothetical protein AKJ16_DCAP20244 [Drosera capensis]